jgi:hypothetical protein
VFAPIVRRAATSKLLQPPLALLDLVTLRNEYDFILRDGFLKVWVLRIRSGELGIGALQMSLLRAVHESALF